MSARLGRYRFLVLIGLVALVGSACASVKGIYTGTVTVTTGVYRLGPFNLAPMDQPGSENQSVQGSIPRPPGNIGIKTMTFDLVDAAGNPVPRMDAHLHHVLLMNHARHVADLFGRRRTVRRCRGRAHSAQAVGLVRVHHELDRSVGRALAHHEHVGERADGLHPVQGRLRRGNRSGRGAPVTPFFMDVTGCGTNAEFNVPGTGGAGSVFTKTRTITAPWTGVAVAAGGHLHDGGIDVSIKRAATGENGCTAVARYDMPEPMEFPSSITSCVMHHTVTAGDNYTLTAHYDNSMPHSAVMGIMIAYVWHGVPPS